MAPISSFATASTRSWRRPSNKARSLSRFLGSIRFGKRSIVLRGWRGMTGRVQVNVAVQTNVYVDVTQIAERAHRVLRP